MRTPRLLRRKLAKTIRVSAEAVLESCCDSAFSRFDASPKSLIEEFRSASFVEAIAFSFFAALRKSLTAARRSPSFASTVSLSLAVAFSTSRASRSPTTLPMLPMMKAESVTPQATRRARIMPVPGK